MLWDTSTVYRENTNKYNILNCSFTHLKGYFTQRKTAPKTGSQWQWVKKYQPKKNKKQKKYIHKTAVETDLGIEKVTFKEKLKTQNIM